MIATYRLEGATLTPVPSTAMTFPAGEAHAKQPDAGEAPTVIAVHGTDANDYLAAAQLADVNRALGLTTTLLVPYLPAARADRGVPFGAQHYADLINLVGAEKVVALDAHSPVMPTLVKNLSVVPLRAVIDEFIDAAGYVGVIAPDEGATQRAGEAAEALGLDLFQATKHRDFESGALTGFSCEALPAEGRLLVVDDICDGGGTFRGLIEATGLPKERVDLWVTHGVFSRRSTGLDEVFGTLHSTDSYGPRLNPELPVTVHQVTEVLVHLAP